MAFQRIRIKNTNVPGKVPGADKLDPAELCINLKDKKLFSKDVDGSVFELGGTVEVLNDIGDVNVWCVENPLEKVAEGALMLAGEMPDDMYTSIN